MSKRCPNCDAKTRKVRASFTRSLAALSLFAIGLALTLTIAGAIIGIPAIIVGALIMPKNSGARYCPKCGDLCAIA